MNVKIEPNPNGKFTVTELHEMFPIINRNKIVYALQTNGLKGERIGWLWVVKLKDFKEWAKQRGYID